MVLSRIKKDNLHELELDNGGIAFTEQKAVPTSYPTLVIGLGGLGCKALNIVKNKYNRQFIKKSHIYFKALDTDMNDLKNIDNYLSDDEKITLYDQRFKNLLTKEIKPLYISNWLNPEIEYLKPENIDSLEDGDSKRIRQIGRVMFVNEFVYEKVRYEIKKTIQEALNTLQYQTMKQINIMLVAGISGGTSGGCLIDLAYMLHDIFREESVDIYKIASYLYMSDVHSEIDDKEIEDILKVNGYATLKELDYYLNLEKEQGRYCLNVANRVISINKNIFDSCTLFSLLKDEQEKIDGYSYTLEATTSLMINFLMSMPIVKNNHQKYLENDFLKINSMDKSWFGDKIEINKYLRTANYKYSTYGYKELYFPKDELLTYVICRIYEKLQAKFKEFPVLTEEIFKNINLVNIDLFNKEELLPDIMNELDSIFSRFGPYAVSWVIDFIMQQIDIIMMEKELNYLKEIKNQLYQIKENKYGNYILILEELALILKNDDIYFKDNLKKHSNYIYLYDILNSGNARINKIEKVKNYLDELVEEIAIQSVFDSFIYSMRQNSDYWLDDEKINIVHEIRGIFNSCLEKTDLKDELVEKIICVAYASKGSKPIQLTPEDLRKQWAISNTSGIKWQALLLASRELLFLMMINYKMAKIPNLYQENLFNQDAYIGLMRQMPFVASKIEESVILNDDQVTRNSGNKFFKLIHYFNVPLYALVDMIEYYELYNFDATPGLHKDEVKENWRSYPELCSLELYANKYGLSETELLDFTEYSFLLLVKEMCDEAIEQLHFLSKKDASTYILLDVIKIPEDIEKFKKQYQYDKLINKINSLTEYLKEHDFVIRECAITSPTDLNFEDLKGKDSLIGIGYLYHVIRNSMNYFNLLQKNYDIFKEIFD